MKKEKIEALAADYKRQFLKLTSTPKRTQQFNHKEQLARLEGQIFTIGLILSQWDDDKNQNIIEQ